MAASRNSLSADLAHRVGEFLAARVGMQESLCVGLSGGCDSVVLLHLLAGLGYSGRLSAIHVNHGLSPHADRWARFCAEFCGQREIPLKIEIVSIDRQSGLGLEAAARAARYAAFADCAADCLLLAQHRGDQAETVLFNLLRGCGVTGAAAMPVERPLGRMRLLRPLLGVSRGELEAYALANGLRWIDDESNADTRLSRNFLRHDVLPGIVQRFPSAESALAQAAANFAEAGVLLDDLADQDWQVVADGEAATIKALRGLSLPRLKNLLRRRLRLAGWRVPVASRLDEFSRQLLTAAPDRHPELQLPEGVMRVVGGRLVWLSEK